MLNINYPDDDQVTEDDRWKKSASTNQRQFVYGLPELNKKEIAKAENIANPGCFATSIQLGLLPLAQEKLLNILLKPRTSSPLHPLLTDTS